MYTKTIWSGFSSTVSTHSHNTQTLRPKLVG